MANDIYSWKKFFEDPIKEKIDGVYTRTLIYVCRLCKEKGIKDSKGQPISRRCTDSTTSSLIKHMATSHKPESQVHIDLLEKSTGPGSGKKRKRPEDEPIYSPKTPTTNPKTPTGQPSIARSLYCIQPRYKVTSQVQRQRYFFNIKIKMPTHFNLF
jgi:hypothetical protein